MSIWGTQSFARYLSGSDKVAGITEYMWQVRSLLPRVHCSHTNPYVYTDDRLVLHILRRLHTARQHPPGDPTTLVPWPITGFKYILGIALGDCGRGYRTE